MMNAPIRKPLPPFDYSQPAGAPAFMGPDSVAWRVYKNQIALGIGGDRTTGISALSLIPISEPTRPY